MTESSAQEQIELDRGPAEDQLEQYDPDEGHYTDQQVPLKVEGVTPVSDTITQEVVPINPEVREAKLGLLRSFIAMTKDGSMEPEEAEDYIARVRSNGFISDLDETSLKHELDVTLGRTPEQIRDSKIGLLKMFIGLTKGGQMDPEEAEDYIAQVRGNGFITEEDEASLKHELDVTLGRTPEQIRDLKMGLLRSFIRMTKDGSMEPEEAEDYIARVRSNGFISDQDEAALRAELASS